jgi:hypothetical protein
MRAPHHGRHAGIGPEQLHAGSAGEDHGVKFGRLDRGERGIGVQRDRAAAGDVDARGESGHGNLDAAAPHQVDGGDGLDFLESLCDDHQGLGHE